MRGGTKRQKDLRKALRALLPRVPMRDAEAILDLALAGHLRHLPPSISLWQATTSHIRHEMTEYDALLEEGYDRDAARYFVAEEMNETLRNWGCNKEVSLDQEPET
ncbi:DUF2293 domain-containing protein [Roseibium sp. SCPC15]|uniref:DUF2293 domain-containing protein n=1 Tax=Roseibium sp. SCP15 TaxID=3141376 RepID=UPI003335E9DD